MLNKIHLSIEKQISSRKFGGVSPHRITWNCKRRSEMRGPDFRLSKWDMLCNGAAAPFLALQAQSLRHTKRSLETTCKFQTMRESDWNLLQFLCTLHTKKGRVRASKGEKRLAGSCAAVTFKPSNAASLPTLTLPGPVGAVPVRALPVRGRGVNGESIESLPVLGERSNDLAERSDRRVGEMRRA